MIYYKKMLLESFLRQTGLHLYFVDKYLKSVGIYFGNFRIFANCIPR